MSTNRLPENVTPIWTPRDSVDTAQAFHLELNNAERGTRVEDFLPPVVLFTAQSRERKARLYDRLAVLLLLALCAALGCIAVILATPAKADVDNVVFAYANTYGSAVCETLDEGHDSIDGLTGIMLSIVGDGLTPYQAGQVVAISVTDGCPQYTPLLRAYVARNGATAA